MKPNFNALAVATVLVLFSMSLPSPTRAGETNDVDVPEGMNTIKMTSVLLSSAIDTLARQSRMNYTIDPKMPDKTLTFQWEHITTKEALARLAKEHGLFLVPNPATTVTRISTTNSIAHPVSPTWIAADTSGPADRIAISSTELDQAVRSLAKAANVTVVMDSELTTTFEPGKPMVAPVTVSFRWENITPRQALAALCENYDLVLKEGAASNSVRISKGN